MFREGKIFILMVKEGRRGGAAQGLNKCNF